MTFEHSAKALVHAPFEVTNGLHQLGRGLWLYLWLLDNANAKGLICRESASIAWQLKIPEPELLDWLARLVALKLVEVKTPPPHLVVKLTLWSGDASSQHHDQQHSSDQSGSPMRIVPVSSKQLAADKNIGVGGAGEGVFADVAGLLGESEAQDLRDEIDKYPEEIVRRAIARVRATPERQIRVSKIALFRYLVTKLNNESPHAH